MREHPRARPETPPLTPLTRACGASQSGSQSQPRSRSSSADQGSAALDCENSRRFTSLGGLHRVLQAGEHLFPVALRVLRGLWARVVVLGERETCSSLSRTELVDEGVVVLGTVLFTAERAVVRQLETPAGLNGDDLPLVLVRLPVVFTPPHDRAARLPVGFDVRPEHVLLDQLRLGQRRPDIVGGSVDLGLGGCDVPAHGDLLVSWVPCDVPRRSARQTLGRRITSRSRAWPASRRRRPSAQEASPPYGDAAGSDRRNEPGRRAHGPQRRLAQSEE